jgi:hypothetical protein
MAAYTGWVWEVGNYQQETLLVIGVREAHLPKPLYPSLLRSWNLLSSRNRQRKVFRESDSGVLILLLNYRASKRQTSGVRTVVLLRAALWQRVRTRTLAV